MRGAFSATKVDVRTADTAHARGLAEIEADHHRQPVAGHIQTRALRIFQRLAEAEAGIHGVPVETIHFHELGAVDTIVDVTGALLALERLGVGRVVASPVPLGRGLARGSHGTFPLPAPATVALLRGAEVVGVDHAVETVTPTAAALLAELAEGFGPIPPMRLTAVGYGAGTRPRRNPTCCGCCWAKRPLAAHGAETLVMLETNIDDMSPEAHGYVVERLLASRRARTPT